ncbi:MAG: hypothetical protein JEZ03_06375 [Bacteroidales bacterium]|nr:hypothetical protein [Bacteroidales bacterium]
MERYKIKFYGLILLLVVLSWIIFKLSISKTVDVYNQIQQIEQRVAQATTNKNSAQGIEQELAHYEGLLLNDTANINVRHHTLLEFTSDFCEQNNLMLISMHQPEIIAADDVKYIRNQLSLQGSFKDLLQYIHTLEKQKGISNIISVDFQLKKDMRKKNEKLYATIVLQDIGQ